MTLNRLKKILILWTIASVNIIVGGCQTFKEYDSAKISEKYKYSDTISKALEKRSPDTYDADVQEYYCTDQPLMMVVREINEKWHAAVNVLDVEPEEKISFTVRGTVQDAVEIIASQSGRQWTCLKGRFLVSKNLSMYRDSIRIEINGVELEEFKTLFKAEDGLSFCQLKNGQVLVTGTVGRLKEVERVADSLIISEDGYLLTMAQVVTSRKKARDLQAKISFSSVDLIARRLDLFSVFEASGVVDFHKTYQDRYVEQSLYLNEGRTVEFTDGTTKQRQNTNISQYGVVTSAGWDTQEDGIILKVEALRPSGRGLDLKLSFEASKFDKEYDKKQSKIVYDSLTVEAGKVYYITQVEDSSRSKGSNFIGLNGSEEETVTTIWLILQKISEISD